MPKPLAPGPVALPLVGALPQIGLGMLAPGLAEQPHRRLAALSQTYGDVMTVNFGREPWLVLSSPEAVHEAFVTKGGDFAGRPQVASMSLSAGSGRAGFGRQLPDAGLRELRRAAYSTLFSDEAVAAKQSELEAEAHLLSDHLLATSGTGEPLRPSLRRCVGNMVLRFAFSSRVPYASEEGAAAPPAPIAELLRLTEAIWDSLAATPTTVLDLLGVPSDNAAREPLRRLVGQRDAVLRQVIADRRAQRRGSASVAAASPASDMLDVLLASDLPEADVLYALVDLFVAGVSTVSTTLEWLLLLTASQPLVQERARSDALCAGSGYVGALTKEVLRAKPPLLLPRTATVETSLRGFRVPRGCVVYANNWALAHSEERGAERSRDSRGEPRRDEVVARCPPVPSPPLSLPLPLPLPLQRATGDPAAALSRPGRARRMSPTRLR
uniref:Cytochrome P450 n=1 Tax=Emiliania huxleyi TaxID=2903 RepID=A0A7S3WBY6_EMIHU